MPDYATRLNAHESDLVTAVRDNADLSDQEWAYLESRASAYQKRVARMIVDPTCAPHGEASTYTNYACRCVPCSEAYSAKRSERTAAQPGKDFADDVPLLPGEVPEQVARLQELVKLGQPLTPKGQQVLDDWEAQQVL